MAKILRVKQEQFGINGNVSDFGQFGSLFVGAPNFTKDPATIQALSAFLNGLTQEVIANNRPALEDFNGLFLLMFRQLAYILQAGICEWDAGTTYFTGDVCRIGNQWYTSLQDNNINQAPASQVAFWQAGIGSQNVPAISGIVGAPTGYSFDAIHGPMATDCDIIGSTAQITQTHGFYAYTDASANPSTEVTKGYFPWVSGAAGLTIPVYFKVRKGHFFKVTNTIGNGGSLLAYPIGV